MNNGFQTEVPQDPSAAWSSEDRKAFNDAFRNSRNKVADSDLHLLTLTVQALYASWN